MVPVAARRESGVGRGVVLGVVFIPEIGDERVPAMVVRGVSV
jgi:hypothetical protein